MFAKIYDELMSDIDYEQILIFLEDYIGEEKTILDAGCGSGYLLRELLLKGYDVIGIDRDDQMLSIAYDRLRSENLKAPLFHHDLKDEIDVSVDIIVSFFDVMNYFKGVKRVFKNIKKSLNEEGMFIFDVYKESVLIEYDGYNEREDEPISYEWSINTDQMKLKHLVIVENNIYKLTQYVKPLSYYLDLLKDLKFKEILVKEGPDPRKHYIIASL